MADQPEEQAAERVDRLLSDVLAGRRLRATTADAAEREAIMLAGRLAGTRTGYPRMSPAFRRRLARLLQRGEAPSWMDRRAALLAGFGVVAGALGGALLERLVDAGNARRQSGGAGRAVPAPARGIIEPRPQLARWVDTGVAISDLVEDVPRRVTAGAIGAYVIRRGDQVIAMSAYCTHVPCELAWLADGRLLNCPCHGAQFDLDGQSLREDYPLPALPLIKVRVRNGRVEVLGT